jgi:hypothetical protein
VTKKSSIINKHFHKVVVVGIQNEKNGLYRLDMIVVPNNSLEFNNLVSSINQLASIIELLHYQITCQLPELTFPYY